MGTNVPDLRGLFLRGQGNFDATRTSGLLGQIQQDQFQGHGHFNMSRNLRWIGGSTGRNFYVSGASVYEDYPQTAGSVEKGYGVPRLGSETRPVNMAVRYLVKARL
jgi:hypothetical protein